MNSRCALGLTTRLALRARFLLRRSRCALAFPARAARSRLAALALRARIFFIENFIFKTIVVRKRFPFLGRKSAEREREREIERARHETHWHTQKLDTKTSYPNQARRGVASRRITRADHVLPSQHWAPWVFGGRLASPLNILT